MARICGFSNFTGRESDVSAVIQVVQNLKTSEAELKVGGGRKQQKAVLHAMQGATLMLRSSRAQRGLRTHAAAIMPGGLEQQQRLMDGCPTYDASKSA